MKNLLFSILGILFLISCETENFQEIENQNQLKITASIAELKTRATETNFQEGDVITLLINEINALEDTICNEFVNSNTKIIEARLRNNEWILDSVIYYPKNVTDSCLRILALYNGGTITDTAIIGNSHNMFSSPDTINDFLCCFISNCYNSVNPVDLKFEHKLSKLKINIKDIDNIGIVDWNINFYGINFGYVVFPKNLQVKSQQIYPDTLYFSKGTFNNQLIIPEQTLNSFEVIINKGTPAENRKYFYENDLKTENGKITYLNINVRKNSFSIDSQILPWQEGETYDKEF